MSWAPATVSTLLFFSQIIIGIYLLPSISQNEALACFGVTLYVLSGIIFGVLPIFEFRKKGEVKKGQNYTHTTKLVDTGIYSIVRHPQYVTYLMWAIAGMLLFQHWIVVLLGIPIFPLMHIDLGKADEEAVEKFGNEYRNYMKKVPRANFLLGLLRGARRRREQTVTS